MEKFNRKQLNIVTNALDVPTEVFTDSLDQRVAALELEVNLLKSANDNLNYRLRILEAENNGLRKALMN